MTQRNRRRQRHRGGARGKLLFVGLGVAALLAIATIGVASLGARRRRQGALARRLQTGRQGRQLDPLRRPTAASSAIDRVRRSARADLDRPHPEEPPARDRRDRGPALLRTRRRRPRGHRPRRAEEPRSRQDGRGRLDDHPAARPQPLHLQPEPATSNARSSRRSWRSSTPNATRGGKSSASTSTPPPTGRSKAPPRSASRPPRRSTSRGRSGS